MALMFPLLGSFVYLTLGDPMAVVEPSLTGRAEQDSAPDFAAMAEKRERDLRESFGKAGVDALELSTGDDLVDVILRFADLRKRRSQVAAGGGMPQHLKATSMEARS